MSEDWPENYQPPSLIVLIVVRINKPNLLVTLLVIPIAVKLDTLRNRTKSTDIFTGDVTNYGSDNDSILLVRGIDTANIVPRHTHMIATFQRLENSSIRNRAVEFHVSGASPPHVNPVSGLSGLNEILMERSSTHHEL